MKIQNQRVQDTSSKGTIQVQLVNFVQILLEAVKHATVELWILCLWISPVITWEFYQRENKKRGLTDQSVAKKYILERK